MWGGKGYPEEYLGHGLLCRLREAPQVVVERCVHHAGVHGVDDHREATGRQLLLQVVGEQNQRQFALSISAMGAVPLPADRGFQIITTLERATNFDAQGVASAGLYLLFKSSISMIPE